MNTVIEIWAMGILAVLTIVLLIVGIAVWKEIRHG